MSQREKLIEAFKTARKTFPYQDFERLLGHLGYEEDKTLGASSGVRREFVHPTSKDIIKFHATHGKEMTQNFIKAMRQHLEDRNLI